MTGNERKRRWIQSFARKAGRTLLIIASSFLACILSLVGVLLLLSRGKPKPFVDENGRPLAGSISEKTHININGVEQGMFIKSKDEAAPVLLWLHGGPGMTDYFLTQRYPAGIEDYFTVVWWEQRGSGLSYSADIPPETMTVEQFIADTLAVTNYLRHRFGKEKIYLLGHSWGSFIGIQAAARAPELYHAYIGMAQLVYQLKSERLAYEYMLKQFKENGNRAMVRKLEAAPVTMTGGTPDAYLAVRDEAMHSLGIGTTHDMKSVITGIFLRSLLSREYTLREKVNLWRGRSFSRSFGIWDKVIRTDLTKQVPELDLPVYFFHGIYDYTANYTLAKDYFEKLKAPLKGFYTFEQSAHSPILEEPEKAQKILQEDVLVGANSLADAYAWLLDALGINQAAIVGMSGGGPSAVQFALRHADQCSALILLSSHGPQSSSLPPKWAFSLLAKTDVVMWAMTTYFRSALYASVGVSKEVLPTLSAQGQQRLVETLETFLPVKPRSAGVLFDTYVSNPDMDRYPFEQITVPTLVLHAKDDPLSSFSSVGAMAARIPGARLVAFERGGHLLLGNEEQVALEITHFLQQQGVL